MPDRQPRVDVLLDDAQLQRDDALHAIEEVIRDIRLRREAESQADREAMRTLFGARHALIEQRDSHAGLRDHREQFKRRATRERLNALREAWDGTRERRATERRRDERRGLLDVAA